MKYWTKIIIAICLLSACSDPVPRNTKNSKSKKHKGVSLIVLGTIQDAGSPHIACKKDCCKDLFEHPDIERQVISLGLIDYKDSSTYLFEASPDIATQCKNLKNHYQGSELPNGIFITHAHIGHYTGLMYLGKEACNAKNISVFAMPRFKLYIENNGPWSQLVNNQNISLQQIDNENTIYLNDQIAVTPFRVPHRDEYSETVGYLIKGPQKKALFIPDIDKWEKWDKSIIEEIKKVDYAFIDGTFYSPKEINNRNISEIPHPFIIESMKKFESLSAEEKKKIVFIHFNHSNPVLRKNSPEYRMVIQNGFRIAQFNEEFEL